MVVGLLLLWVVGKSASPVSAAAPRVVEAERFILRDAAGRSRAVLGVDGSVSGLTLNDEHEVARVALLVNPRGTVIGLNGENGKARVMLNANADGSGLSLQGENEKQLAALLVQRDRGSSFTLTDGTAIANLHAGQQEGGGPGLRLNDGTGDVTILANKQHSALRIGGKAKDMGDIWLTFNDGDPMFHLIDKYKKSRVIVGYVPRTIGNVWGQSLQDSNGNTLWAVP
jgi:hypothetical protein